ncbi:hypothetical protein [Streptomyces sp. MW-W600-10]|uniref:hypothetical protein n=1 Tax=Streptomyces sp. MW-W600-10 TaxID=2829819 RepID=UPI002109CA73|nr:hypothetical protein [Streptomyces sp. MW-W600-10]
MSPAVMALITMVFQGPERNRALGVWAAIGGTGAAFGVLLGGVLISAFFLCSLYLQHVLGFSSPRTGLMILPVALATAVGAHLGSVLMARLGRTLLPKGRPDPSEGPLFAR